MSFTYASEIGLCMRANPSSNFHFTHFPISDRFGRPATATASSNALMGDHFARQMTVPSSRLTLHGMDWMLQAAGQPLCVSAATAAATGGQSLSAGNSRAYSSTAFAAATRVDRCTSFLKLHILLITIMRQNKSPLFNRDARANDSVCT